ncbi:MAG TPA: hypothetical protein VNN25_19010 [Thermoanaerobaculia bacterium]|nr:hypothetical protein [Thermoanaerobaculia bacterium]
MCDNTSSRTGESDLRNPFENASATLRALAAAGGFTIEQRWTDRNGYFADLLMVAR